MSSQSPSFITPEMVSRCRAQALAYLREQFGNDAPAELTEPTVFPHSPLDGEGLTAVFEFRARRGIEIDQRYFVVSGETEPNYYAAADLTPEDAFELHLGTRFMLVLGVAQASAEQDDTNSDYDPRRDAEQIVSRVSAEAVVEDVQRAAQFDVNGERHAVLRCRVSGTPVYVMGRDAPIGFSTRVHLPPHVAYRLHIGHVLRREAKPELD